MIEGGGEGGQMRSSSQGAQDTDLCEAQEKSVVQGWRAAALTPAGNVSALCQASTPGPFTTWLGKTSIPTPTRLERF